MLNARVSGGFGCAIIAVLFFGTAACAAVLHVPSQYPTIQAALGAATHGDEIVVADGTYSGPGFRDLEFGGLLVTLRSASGDPALCTLDCQQSGRAFVFDNDETAESIVEGFTIAYGFMLNYGGAMYIGDATPTIRNCIFDNCYADFDGGAVFVEDDSPSFVVCLFLNNVALGNGAGVGILNGSPSFSGCVFQSNTAYQNGGGASISGGSPSFENCVFQDNTAYDDGGGMYAFQCSTSIAACDFAGNSASDQGGAIRYVSEDDCTISDSTFSENTAGRGGAIYFARAGATPTMTLVDCEFSDNSITTGVTGKGGAIYVNQAALILNQGLFEYNSATNDGGAIYVEGWLDATDAFFQSNSATNAGGAISADLAGVTLTGCTFQGNYGATEVTGGGAIYLSESDLSATGCTFDSNSIPLSGGALYNSDGEATLTDCTFSDNMTGFGGFVDTGGGAIATVLYGQTSLIGGVLSDNMTARDGGALYVGSGSSASADGCTFEGNQSLGGELGGGAILNTGPVLSLTACDFLTNTAPRFGGAVCNLGGAVTVADSTFTGNWTTVDTLNPSEDDGGGGIANLMNGSLTITGSTFTSNTSADDGGGVANFEDGAVEVEDCTFVTNHALSASPDQDGCGGAIWSGDYGGIITQATLIVRDSWFEANYATGRGGAINGGIGDIIGCTFVGNGVGHTSDIGIGGAVGGYWKCPSIWNSRFVGNDADQGGAVYHPVEFNPPYRTITNCMFSGNMAELGGAVFVFASSQSYDAFFNCTFSGNTATDEGGAFWTPGDVGAHNSIFWQNAPDQITGSNVRVYYSDVQGGWSGAGNNNVNIDPIFVDADGPDNIPGTVDDNLRLAPLSPCIDAADNNSVPPDTADLDGDTITSEPCPLDLDFEDRFVDDPATPDTGNGSPPIVDMGAYEFQTCPADINNDDVVDVQDLLLLLAAWGATSGPADVNHDGIVDVQDLLILLGTWGPCPG